MARAFFPYIQETVIASWISFLTVPFSQPGTSFATVTEVLSPARCTARPTLAESNVSSAAGATQAESRGALSARRPPGHSSATTYISWPLIFIIFNVPLPGAVKSAPFRNDTTWKSASPTSHVAMALGRINCTPNAHATAPPHRKTVTNQIAFFIPNLLLWRSYINVAFDVINVLYI